MPEHNVRKSENWIPLLFLVSFFLVLILAPILLTRTQFKYRPPSSEGTRPVDLDFQTKIRRLDSQVEVSLSDLLKRSPAGVIVNLWATWCPPCLDELPSLERMARQLKAKSKGQGPLLVAISVDENAATVSSFLKSLGYASELNFYHDPRSLIAKGLGTQRFPETYWFSQKGELLHKWVGPQDWTGSEVLDKLSYLMPSIKKP